MLPDDFEDAADEGGEGRELGAEVLEEGNHLVKQLFSGGRK